MKLDSALYSFRGIAFDPGQPSPEESDVVDNYFYGQLTLSPRTARTSGRRIFTDYMITEAFQRYSYEGFHAPAYEPTRLGSTFGTMPELLAECATNYILRNLFHNFVHTWLQGINYSNYRRFGGQARFQSDFEADNLSTVLLAKAYGLNVEAVSLNSSPDSDIVVLLRRNRCNRMFALRARQRRQEDSLEEIEWRYCRSLSNYLSGWLVAAGRTPASLGIYLTGRVIDRRGRLTRVDSEIVAEINGVRIAADEPGLAEHLTSRQVDQRSHFREVAHAVDQRYRAILRKDAALRTYAASALVHRLRQAGVQPQ